MSLMYDLVVLNSDQAAYVRGNDYLNGAHLMPVPMMNKEAMAAAGEPYVTWAGPEDWFYLPARLITNPDYVSVSGYMSAIYAAMPGTAPHILDVEIIYLPPPDDE